jgi:hypothetical protein
LLREHVGYEDTPPLLGKIFNCTRFSTTLEQGKLSRGTHAAGGNRAPALRPLAMLDREGGRMSS